MGGASTITDRSRTRREYPEGGIGSMINCFKCGAKNTLDKIKTRSMYEIYRCLGCNSLFKLEIIKLKEALEA